jgi:hypothetical protein
VSPAAGRYSTLIALVERLTGQKVHVLDPAEVGSGPQGGQEGAPAPEPATAVVGIQGPGQEITVSHTIVEQEGTAVSAAGSVTTADGKQLDFGLDLELYRQSARSTTARMTEGAPEPKDPLALSFGATPSLSGQRAAVDLDGDGTADSLPLLGDGLAYLAFDRDGDGAVTNGQELFGPSTGNGFTELAGYDADHNGWIDEADPIYGRLSLWNGDVTGL